MKNQFLGFEESEVFSFGALNGALLRFQEIRFQFLSPTRKAKKGRFRSLFIHDSGVKFMDIHTSKTNADAIVEQLLNANPSIEIRHANYL